MGSSQSNSLGGTPQWKETRKTLGDLARLIPVMQYSRPIRAGLARSTPLGPANAKESIQKAIEKILDAQTGRSTKSKPGSAAGGGAVGSASATGSGGGTRSIRAFGRQILEAYHKDSRFLSLVELLEDCAIRVALNQLFSLSNSVTITRWTIQQLFKEYRADTSASVPALGLAEALNERFGEQLTRTCGKITDNAEKARVAMQNTLVEMLTGGRFPDAMSKLSAREIHTALKKDTMDVVGKFYSNYLLRVQEFLISSNHANIPRAVEQALIEQLRTDYCDYIGTQIVERARSKGWRPGEIPEKASEWLDLLIGEEVHV